MSATMAPDTATTGIAIGLYTDTHTPATWPRATGGLITGGTGAGKTSAIAHIAAGLAAQAPTIVHTASPRPDLTTALAAHGVGPAPAREDLLAEVVRMRHDHHMDTPNGWPTHPDPIRLILLDETVHVLRDADAEARHAWTYIARHGRAVGVIIIATSIDTRLERLGGDPALRDALTSGTHLDLYSHPRGRGNFQPTSEDAARPVALHLRTT